MSRRDIDIARTKHLLLHRGQIGLDRNDLGEDLRPGQVNAVQTSGPILVEMHAKGEVACLAEKVDGLYVYVLPQFVDGRETRPYKRKNVPVGDLTYLIEQQGDWVAAADLQALIDANPYA